MQNHDAPGSRWCLVDFPFLPVPGILAEENGVGPYTRTTVVPLSGSDGGVASGKKSGFAIVMLTVLAVRTLRSTVMSVH